VPPARGNIHILEKPKSLYPGTAVLYSGGVELALLGNTQFSPNYFVACLSIARNVNPVDIDLRSFINPI